MFVRSFWRAWLATVAAVFAVCCIGVSGVFAAQPAADTDDLETAQVGVPIPLPLATYWLDNGFAELAKAAPEVVGTPISTERPGDEEGSVVQLTSTGLLYWRGSGHPVVHFDGKTRVALTNDRGLVNWAGEALDPPAPAPVAPAQPVAAYGVWDRLAGCESGGDWHSAKNPVYKGGVQIDAAFWARYGGLDFAARPDYASRDQQIIVAARGQAVQGWRAWPHCSVILGLR